MHAWTAVESHTMANKQESKQANSGKENERQRSSIDLSRSLMADPGLFRPLSRNTPVKAMPPAARPKANPKIGPPPPPPPDLPGKTTIPPGPPAGPPAHASAGEPDESIAASVQSASTAVLESATRLIKKLQKDHSNLRQEFKEVKEQLAVMEKEMERKEVEHGEELQLALKKQRSQLAGLVRSLLTDVDEAMRLQLDYKHFQ